MRMISKAVVNNKAVITTEQRHWLFWTKERKFEAQRQLTASYWEWLELPDKKIVPDALSFQLDAWNR